MGESFFGHQPEEKPADKIPELEKSQANETGSSFSVLTDDDSRLGVVMAYLPFLCFLPLMNMRQNHEVRFHARQGVMLFLIELVAFLFLVDKVSDFVFTAILVVAVAFSIAGVYLGLQGKNFRLPIISDLADKAKL